MPFEASAARPFWVFVCDSLMSGAVGAADLRAANHRYLESLGLQVYPRCHLPYAGPRSGKPAAGGIEAPARHETGTLSAFDRNGGGGNGT